ncbi:MAG TPA: hypothetical protein VNO33_08170 [Kofleriaceae bacterium]|nr:hypothetical protein [Kofleriaceae bacterium]
MTRLGEESVRERLAELPAARRREIAEAGRELVLREQLGDPAIPFSFHTLPLVLDAERVERALASCSAVIQGLVRLEQRALQQEGELRARLLGSLDPPGRRLFEMCNFESPYSLEHRFRRVDAMLVPGGCGVLEVNQAAPAFLHFHDALQRIAGEMLGMLGFEHPPALLAPRVVTWLAGEYRHRLGTESAPEVVAVVSEAGYPFKQLELPAFTAACERAARDLGLGTRFHLCYPHELRLVGERIWLGDVPIDMIWRNSALLDSYAGREHEIEDYLRISARHEEHLIVNSTRVWLTLTKDALSLLGSEAVLDRLGFATEERRRLLEAVPRTASLAFEPDLADEIIGAREDWISKPAAGSFSRGFEAGHWHSDASWRQLVRERSGPDFVFQRFVRAPAGELLELDDDGELHRRAMRFDFCPHHVDGAFPGTALVRARVEGVTGGRIIPLVVA